MILINGTSSIGNNISSSGGSDISSVDVLTAILAGSDKNVNGIVGTNVYIDHLTDPDTFIIESGFYNIEEGEVRIP